MYNKKSKLIYSIILIIFLIGCGNKNETNDVTETLEITFVDEDSLKNIIQQKKGKPVFVNVWATWCVPCVEEFPDIVKVHNEYKDSVEFISLSVDLESDADSLVIPFLNKQNAEFPVYIIKEKSSEEVINYLKPEWSGAVPATFIYDKDGNLQKFLLGAQDYVSLKNSIDSVKSL